MPRGDGTGPMGLGPITGRAAGYCNGYAIPGFMNQRFGFRRGGGCRFRRGSWATGIPGWARFFGTAANGFYPAAGLDPARETQILTNQIELMEQSLKNAKERLNELQKISE